MEPSKVKPKQNWARMEDQSVSIKQKQAIITMGSAWRGKTVLFGDYVHQLRIDREFILRTFCKEAGIEAKHWSAVERNALPPLPNELTSVAILLQLTPTEMKKFDQLAKQAAAREYPPERTEEELSDVLPRFARTEKNEKPSQQQLRAIAKLAKKNY